MKNLGDIAYQMKVTASLETHKDKLFITWPNIKFGTYDHVPLIKSYMLSFK